MWRMYVLPLAASEAKDGVLPPGEREIIPSPPQVRLVKSPSRKALVYSSLASQQRVKLVKLQSQATQLYRLLASQQPDLSAKRMQQEPLLLMSQEYLGQGKLDKSQSQAQQTSTRSGCCR